MPSTLSSNNCVSCVSGFNRLHWISSIRNCKQKSGLNLAINPCSRPILSGLLCFLFRVDVSEDVVFIAGHFDEWQSWQSKKNFSGRFVVSLLDAGAGKFHRRMPHSRIGRAVDALIPRGEQVVYAHFQCLATRFPKALVEPGDFRHTTNTDAVIESSDGDIVGLIEHR